MPPFDYLKTIYLGDRWLQKIIIDGENNTIIVQVNLISRIKEGTERWDFYSEEDIENGQIIFSDVKKFTFDPIGYMPNDFIQIEIDQQKDKNQKYYEFHLFFGHGTKTETKTINLKIWASAISLQDPNNPSRVIR